MSRNENVAIRHHIGAGHNSVSRVRSRDGVWHVSGSIGPGSDQVWPGVWALHWAPSPSWSGHRYSDPPGLMRCRPSPPLTSAHCTLGGVPSKDGQLYPHPHQNQDGQGDAAHPSIIRARVTQSLHKVRPSVMRWSLITRPTIEQVQYILVCIETFILLFDFFACSFEMVECWRFILTRLLNV